jgi:hypothetical protein
VHLLQAVLLLGSEYVVTDDREVDIAGLVSIARREGAMKVRATEVATENRPSAIHELAEHCVELRIGRRIRDLTKLPKRDRAALGQRSGNATRRFISLTIAAMTLSSARSPRD